MKASEAALMLSLIVGGSILGTITAGYIMRRFRNASTVLATASDGFDT